MTYLPDTQDPAIRDALMLVCDALTEIEDTNLYERQGTAALDDEQHQLTMAVRERVEAQRMAVVRTHAEQLARKSRKAQRGGMVVDLTGKRVA